ncbi:MAG TPA: OmpA family protein [Nitrospira sp.]|nr:OmpA family protein [Nitrospira sp.]
MPTLTRTGEVKDVVITEGVEPTSVTVNPGDEIRWINKRQGVVRVIFLSPMTENLTCQRHFGGRMGFGTKRNEYSARLRPNKTASVCFREAGEVRYVVRAESSDSSGEQNLAGTISIGPEYQARRPGVEPVNRNAGLAAHSDKNEAAAIMSSRLVAADRDRQRLAEELAIAQRQLAERDASLASLHSQLDQRLAAQAGKDEAYSDMSSRLAAADQDRQRLAEELAVAQGQLADRDASLASLSSQLEQNKSNLAHAEKDILKALQPEISNGTVMVQQSGQALTINLASSLLFDSGQDHMKAGATDALKRVGTVLKDFPDKQVHVAGYTDNVAITGSLQKKFPSNKELSDARANSAAQALRDGGLSVNLEAAGYGDSNPIATNTTATGRAKNRRVEIIVASSGNQAVAKTPDLP